jgi:hypothetical protein
VKTRTALVIKLFAPLLDDADDTDEAMQMYLL